MTVADTPRPLAPVPILGGTTPPSPGRRDLVLDAARAFALGVVVLWHWVLSTISFDATGPHAGNPVGVVDGLWALTWLLQVMPLFFLVGGAVHAAALVGDRRHGFVRRRLRRLVVPTLPLVVPAAAVWFAATAAGRPDVAATVVLAASPLWFAAVYSMLVVLAPPLWEAQRRRPVLTMAALVAAVAAVDVGRFAFGLDQAAWVLTSLVVVWAAVHQLGFWWERLRAAPLAVRLAVAAGGFVGMAALVWLFGYPASMVGVPGQPVSNMGPPTAAVLFLGVAQLGLLAALAGPVGRWALQRRALLKRVSAWAMTMFVWHMAAYLLAFAVVRAAGVEVGSDPSEWSWWAQRPLWLAAPAAIAVPLCILTRRFDRAPGR